MSKLGFHRKRLAFGDAFADVPTIFFIDPCGTKDITIPKLRPLLEQTERAPTEILLRVDPVMLSRFGWVKSAERDEQ